MGSHFRDIYVSSGWIASNESIAANQIYIRSTAVWRTQQSALSMVNGLFPGSSGKFTLYVYPGAIETMLPQSGMCPRIGQLEQEIWNKREWVEFKQSIQGYREELRDIMGINIIENDPAAEFDQIFARKWFAHSNMKHQPTEIV